MSREKGAAKIKMIPIDRINILNPRERNQKKFFDIATNITQVGLKKPITVMPLKSGAKGKDYDLVCGQGRLEAFMACGQKEIPALVIDVSEEQALIMSLVENLTRRRYRPADLLQGIEILKKQGYDARAIADKIGLSKEYVYGVLRLMENGEERLLAAVETGQLSIALAIRIASSPHDEQIALQEALDSGQLKGRQFLLAMSLLDRRRRRGKGFVDESGRKRDKSGDKKPSGQSVVKAYKREVNRMERLVHNANRTSEHLFFIKKSLRDLLKAKDFKALLQTEKLPTMPKPLNDFIKKQEDAHGKKTT